MRIPLREFTPGIRATLARFSRPDPGTEFDGNALAQQAARWQRWRFKFWTIASLEVGCFALVAREGKVAWEAVAVLALVALVVFFLLRAREPLGKTARADFLLAALPRLGLSPPQRLFLETIVRRHRQDGTEEETVEVLRSLALEDERLAGLEAEIGGEDAHAIRQDRDAIAARVRAAVDGPAHRALEESLALIEARLASAEQETAARDRVAAHRELLAQTILSAERSNSRADLSAPSSAELDLDSLRTSLHAFEREAGLLEAAVQEMRAL